MCWGMCLEYNLPLSGLLCVLVVLHMYWFSLIARIAWRADHHGRRQATPERMMSDSGDTVADTVQSVTNHPSDPIHFRQVPALW